MENEEVTFRNVHNGHEQTYNWIRKFLKECDFSDAARRLGFKLFAEHSMQIDFLCRTYKIENDTVTLLKENKHWENESRILDFNIKSILCYYAISKGAGEPLYDFTPLNGLSSGIFSSGKQGSDWMTKALRENYGSDYKKFAATAKDFGMDFVKTTGEGKYFYQYNLLPKVPVQVVYYEGDEDFPTEIKILVDKKILDFFSFESAAVLLGCFVSAFAAFGKN